MFIVEDDAQNGPMIMLMHIVQQPMWQEDLLKSNYVDHTMYSTSSMLRTIELILGLPPMSQYDASATPMWKCFSDSANHALFSALQEKSKP